MFAQPWPWAMYFGTLVTTTAAVGGDVHGDRDRRVGRVRRERVGARAACASACPSTSSPAPEPRPTVRPAGIASLTVTVEPPTGSASLGASRRLETVIVIVPVPPRTNVCRRVRGVDAERVGGDVPRRRRRARAARGSCTAPGSWPAGSACPSSRSGRRRPGQSDRPCRSSSPARGRGR